MAEKAVFKMFLSIFFFLFIFNVSFSLALDADDDPENKCSCFNVCCKNYTTNAVYDVAKIAACQRGCRYYILDLHSSHELNQDRAVRIAKKSCLKTCYEGYTDPNFRSACERGCSVFDTPTDLCKTEKEVTPQMSYSLIIEESDVLIHSGEPEPDDSLTDPVLRKQIQKTLVAMLEATPRLPDIRFKSLPVKRENETNENSKCLRFFGFCSYFEFRNGKLIIADMYLFFGVIVFVVICLFLTYFMEKRNLELTLPLLEARMEKEPLLNVDFHLKVAKAEMLFPGCIANEILFSEDVPEDILSPDSEQTEPNKIDFVFPNGELAKETKKEENSPEI